MGLNFLPQKSSDVLELEVARGVALLADRLYQILAGTLGHHNDRVGTPKDAPLQRSQQAAWTVEREGHLGDQAEIHILAGDRGPSGDEPGVAAHQFDQRNPVVYAVRLCVRAFEDF